MTIAMYGAAPWERSPRTLPALVQCPRCGALTMAGAIHACPNEVTPSITITKAAEPKPRLELTVIGPPVPWARVATQRTGRRVTPEKQHKYRAHVKACLWHALHERKRTLGAWPFHARYRLTLTFHTAPGPRGGRVADIDNLAKIWLDAGNGVTWKDDAQVKALVATVITDRERPRVECSIDVISDVHEGESEGARKKAVKRNRQESRK